jgi:hypothetical protein
MSETSLPVFKVPYAAAEQPSWRAIADGLRSWRRGGGRRPSMLDA